MSRVGAGQSGSFALSLREFAAKANEAIDASLREIIIEIGSSVIRMSPVGNPEIWAANVAHRAKNIREADDYDFKVALRNTAINLTESNFTKAGNLRKGVKYAKPLTKAERVQNFNVNGLVAGQGYVVAVPEVYHEYEPAGTVLRYDAPGTERGNTLKFAKPVSGFDADAHAAIGFLRDHPACTGRIGSLGICLGGHLAYRAALDPAVSAVACFYATDIHSKSLGEGRNDDSLARMDELKAEALFVWGRQDPHVPFAGRQAIRERLEEVGARYEWHEVNGAHAFLRDEGPRYDPALFLQAIGWTLALFQRTLGGHEPAGPASG